MELAAFAREVEAVVTARTVFHREHVDPSDAVLLGLATQRIGAATLFMGRLPSARWLNVTLGLGVEEPAEPEQLEAIVDAYHGVGRFRVIIPPTSEPSTLPAWLARHGFIRLRGVDVWHRRAGQPDGPGGVWVEPVAEETLDTWWRLSSIGLDLDPRLRSYFCGSYGKPGWRHYLARIDGRPVGASQLFCWGGLALCSLGAVMPWAADRNAAASLLAWAMRDAFRNGCERFIALAARTGDAPAVEMLGGHGFEPAHQRIEWERQPMRSELPRRAAAVAMRV